MTVDEDVAAPLYQQVYEQMRDAITQGRLTEGDKLPSIRGLSKSLGISHITIEKAYLQLDVEGYVESVPRSGFVVRHVDIDYFKNIGPDNAAEVNRISARRRAEGFMGEVRAGQEARYDFSYFNLQPGSFPLRTWSRLYNEALLSLGDTALVGYPVGSGPSSLQIELAKYLNRVRGLNCSPEQVLVFPGTETALSAFLSMFDPTCDVVGVEEPGYLTALDVAARGRFEVAPLTCGPGSSEQFLADLETSRSRVVFTTPSHQYPTGIIMPLDTRVRLIEWAHANGAFVIEDDSCYEYRYATRAIPSLQSLDTRNRVAYLCNFSKALSPALRIAYMVLPPELLDRYYDAHGTSYTDVPSCVQATLARFIANGHYDQHVRRMQTSNHARHDRLLKCLTNKMGDAIELSGVDSGMHFFMHVKNGMTQEELIASAREQGANVYATRNFWFAHPAPDDALMIGFSSIALDDIEPGVDALYQAWFG